MAHESTERLIENLVAHVFDGDVSSSLLEHGSFPPNWVSRYVALLERASNVFRDQPSWPRELVGTVHFASFYLEGRYDLWRRTSGRANERTEAMLREIRGPSEIFLLAGITGRRPAAT